MKQLFFVLLAMMMALTACARPPAETTPTTAPEVTAELETAEPEAPAGEEAAAEEVREEQASEEEKQEQPKEKAQLAPEYTTPNSVVISEKTVLGSAADIEKKEEKTSWFSDVICGKLYPDSQSMVTFTVENRGKKSYYLSRVGVEDVTEKDGLGIRLNSDRIITDAKKQCGTDLLTPGKKATCTVKEKLRKGKTYWEKELVNKLAANSVGVYTELKFKCEGIAE